MVALPARHPASASISPAADLANYQIFKTELKVGSGPTALDFTLVEVTFMDGEFGDFNEHELEGKGKDWHLIDADGKVHSV